MNSGDWWWDMQDRIPPGDTVIPLICSSDETHLINYSGDKKGWPMYLTLRNIHSSIRTRPKWPAKIILALLSIPPNPQGTPTERLSIKKSRSMILHDTMHEVMSPLRQYQEGISTSKLSDCADGKMRRCWHILASWVADHMEHANVMATMLNSCLRCTVLTGELGEYKQPHEMNPRNQEGHRAK
ncbi:hypothetical protein BDD12DRAFT_747561 [Trichophaea hybrida]|nr:hypothetical protein BDD12DRAFT_747561 [Trichophaea hybrida]